MVWIGITLITLAAFWLWLHQRSRFTRLPAPRRALEEHPTGSIRGVDFPAKDGTRLDGWLFLPGIPRAPVVLMAPGLGGTKDGFLESFAWKLVERGIAVLVFDYRCFGGSDGTPRHWVDPARHGEDYEAALSFVAGGLGDSIDPARIGLWGSSFSGGTAIVVAARHPEVRALVAQCPYLKTPPALQPRGFAMLRYVFWTALDMLRVLPPIYVPLFGRPGEWVFAPSLENPSAHDFGGALGAPFWRALPKPALGGWENRMLARALAGLDGFVPMEHVAAVRCPMQLIASRRDDMVPLPYVEEAYRLAAAPDKQLVVLDAGHFDLYVGPLHEDNARKQAAFFAERL